MIFSRMAVVFLGLASLVAAGLILFVAFSGAGSFALDEPSMDVVQHNSPVNIGDDEGRLENSRQVNDSVLVACKRDHGGRTIESRGRRAVGTHIYSVKDGTDNGKCNRNFTGRNLRQHWLEEGSLQSQVSNHS